MAQHKKFGYVALIGKPNVGKSTLMNTILGKKLSITSSKPQTTRYRIIGIKTTSDAQIAYVDTPGLHFPNKRTLNRVMNRIAKQVLKEVNVILLIIDALRLDAADATVLKQLKSISTPIILVINKIDRIKDKSVLLPLMESLSRQLTFEKIIPISAKTGIQVPILEENIFRLLPDEPALYPPEQLTDRSDRFIAAEFVREKLTRLLADELPYDLAVTVELFEYEENMVRIHAVIWIEKESQKAIVIGKHGAILKQVGTQARQDLECYYGQKVFLKLWAKVKKGWSDNERILSEFGIE